MEKLKQNLPHPAIWLFALVASVVFIELASTYVRVWSPEYGLTKLITAGRNFEERAIPAYRNTPKFMDPYWGFDGQWYAQLSLDPLLRDPNLGGALDNPAYRARRILMPWISWLVGFGKPVWVLNVYAGLNLAFWVLYAFLMARLFRPHGWAGFLGFAVMLPTCGIIECMKGSLTDFPGFVLMTWAVMMAGTKGSWMMAAAMLSRETNLFGMPGLLDFEKPWVATMKRNIRYAIIALGPFAIWYVYMRLRLPTQSAPVNPDDSIWRKLVVLVSGNNLELPMAGIMSKLGEFSVDARTGVIRWNRVFFEIYKSYELNALLTIVSIITQCVFLLTNREWKNRIWRMAIIYVPVFLCIGPLAWEVHFTVTRHALPITLAFNLLLAMRPGKSWLIWFLLGNCFMPYGLYDFTTRLYRENPPAPAEFIINARSQSSPPVVPAYGENWSEQEFEGRHSWRWALTSATLTLQNTGTRTQIVDVSFILNSLSARDLTIKEKDRVLWSGKLSQAKMPVTLPSMTLPPGKTLISFVTAQNPIPAPNYPDDNRYLAFKVYDPVITVLDSPASGANK